VLGRPETSAYSVRVRVRCLRRRQTVSFATRSASTPGYVCSIVGSILTGRPVKWVEDRSENLMTTSFARDYHMSGSIAATRDGKVLGVRVKTLADHGAFNGSRSRRSSRPGSSTSSPARTTCRPRTARSPASTRTRRRAGVAYACSFRITEAVYLVERLMDLLAAELDVDPAELRMKNLLQPEQFPYTCATAGSTTPATTHDAPPRPGHGGIRRAPQGTGGKAGARRADGLGISFFTEAVGAGPRKHMDILGFGMADGAELRVHPHREGVLRISVQTQGRATRRRSRRSSRGAGHPGRRRRGGARRHRPDAVRARHVRLALDPGLRRRDRRS